MSRRSIYPVFLPYAGCPHRCIYCAQNLTSSCQNVPDPMATLDTLLRALPQQGLGELAFYGGSFTLLDEFEQERWLAIGTKLIAEGRIAALRVSTRPDAVSLRTAQRLAAAGVTTVELGCQSFSDTVLQRAGRGHNSAAVAQSLPCLQSLGIAVGIHLMPGLPGSDDDEALCSLTAALAFRPDFLRIHPTVVLRDTVLEQLYRNGEYIPLELEAAVRLCAEMLRVTRVAKVPVIRFGLMANEDLDHGDAVVAGPYHPAFGQLVRSHLWLELVVELAATGERFFRIHPADLSDLLGQRRSNYHTISDRFGALDFETSESLARETIESSGVISFLFPEKN